MPYVQTHALCWLWDLEWGTVDCVVGPGVVNPKLSNIAEVLPCTMVKK